MTACRKLIVSFSVITCFLVTLVPAPAAADPIRLTVQFAVAGDARLDPDFGTQRATGTFTVVTQLPVGGGIVENFETGLDAQRVSFSWAGHDWTTANADVPRLFFTAEGALSGWLLSGFPLGLDRIGYTISPDISVDSFSFAYTTPRSLEVGVLKGELLSWEASSAPVPEPASLLLFASGLAGVVARYRARSRLRS